MWQAASPNSGGGGGGELQPMGADVGVATKIRKQYGGETTRHNKVLQVKLA